uniref:Uncharacterized protein n=1 Tax=Spongospora subterranea TaxID=70186 RepID=A0A0H5QYT0_9EUKA|eukprot:CRZ06813.1 hypothetical protein [Spongospora subterranea]
MGLDTYLSRDPNQGNRIELRNDKLAIAQISLRLTQPQYKQVSSCKTTRQKWTRLKEIYDISAESKAAELFLQFIHIQKKSSQTMKNYLDRIVELHHDLKPINKSKQQQERLKSRQYQG